MTLISTKFFTNVAIRPHPMANIYVLIVVAFGVCSFNLCVYSQTLQTFTILTFFMAFPIIEEISRFGSP